MSKTILLVDDSLSIRRQLEFGLKKRFGGIDMIEAQNGEEAVARLREHEVDLLITDLSMPVMDGFSLLAEVKQLKPELPFIVITSFAAPRVDTRLVQLDELPVVPKPIDYDELAVEIEAQLYHASTGQVRAVTLPVLLQLLHWERKTCSLVVTAPGRQGSLHFRSGVLVNASVPADDLEGEAAAVAILGWADADVEVEHVGHDERRLIERSLAELLLAASGREAEAQWQPEPGFEPVPGSKPDAAPARVLAEVAAAAAGLAMELGALATASAEEPLDGTGREERRRRLERLSDDATSIRDRLFATASRLESMGRSQHHQGEEEVGDGHGQQRGVDPVENPPVTG